MKKLFVFLIIIFLAAHISVAYAKSDVFVTGKLGEKITIEGRKIAVYGFQEYSDSSMIGFGGDRGYAMEVLIKNTTDSTFHVSPLDFTVQNEKGMAFTHYHISSGGKRPEIKSEYIAPGQKIRGYITYVINSELKDHNDETPYVVYYKDDKMIIRIDLK